MDKLHKNLAITANPGLYSHSLNIWRWCITAKLPSFNTFLRVFYMPFFCSSQVLPLSTTGDLYWFAISAHTRTQAHNTQAHNTHTHTHTHTYTQTHTHTYTHTHGPARLRVSGDWLFLGRKSQAMNYCNWTLFVPLCCLAASEDVNCRILAGRTALLTWVYNWRRFWPHQSWVRVWVGPTYGQNRLRLIMLTWSSEKL